MSGGDRPGNVTGAPLERGRRVALPLVGRSDEPTKPPRKRSGAGRRRFMAGLATIGAAAVAQAAASPIVDAAPAEAPAEAPAARLADLPAEREGEGALLRMQRELQRALQKPIGQRR